MRQDQVVSLMHLAAGTPQEREAEMTEHRAAMEDLAATATVNARLRAIVRLREGRYPEGSYAACGHASCQRPAFVPRKRLTRRVAGGAFVVDRAFCQGCGSELLEVVLRG